MWWMKTVFVGFESEHGNWSAVGCETKEEVMEWWNASRGKATYVREQTLTDPNGNVVETRSV